MVLTVEPGVYFIRALLEPVLSDPSHPLHKYFVKDRITALLDFGGVRLEDDVLVTEQGVEVFTDVPKGVDQIEAWMAGK